MEAGWSARRVARQLDHSDCVVRRGVGTIGSERCHLHQTQAQDALNRPVVKKIVRYIRVQPTASSAAIQAQTHGERLNPALVLQRHTIPTTGVMVCGAIAYNTRSLLVFIRGTMTGQRYVHAILQPHVLPLMQWLPGAIFQQDNVRPHTARVFTRLSPHSYYPSVTSPIPRFVFNRAYMESFGMASWASHEFKRTRGKVTANMERNVSRHHTELVCLNARSYRIVHSH
ncbi:transposable element Tcb1 transposase [Trichonephila clavipes]|nr:transposable element Tcb1 transposase [Trichonephila clavipes]